MLITILNDPNKILRKVATELTPLDFSSGIASNLHKEMRHVMEGHKGRGFAANQVGVPKRMILVEIGGVEECMCNPTIVALTTDLVYEGEGCLSIPGVFARVPRPKEITVKWESFLTNVEHEATFSGITARIISHELDHLVGILFTDRLSKSQMKALKKEHPFLPFQILHNSL